MTFALGFIGCGNMAEAIARAAIGQSTLSPEQIIAADPSAARQEVFAQIGIIIAEDNAQVIEQSEQVMLAVKPQIVSRIADDLASHLRDDQIVISIMAGIGTAKLAQEIGKAVRIVRVMPNTPLMVSHGMAGICLGGNARAGDDDLAMKLFGSAANKAIRIDESAMDALTAISGSGPAYLFYLAEAMTQAAKQMGLEKHARMLVSQTLAGAAKLLNESSDEPAQLRQKVTSPGGTTEAAINHMEQNQLRDVIAAAMQKAAARSKELGA